MGPDFSKDFPGIALEFLISKSEPSGRGVDLFPAEELAKHDLQNEAAPREGRQTRHPGEEREFFGGEALPEHLKQSGTLHKALHPKLAPLHLQLLPKPQERGSFLLTAYWSESTFSS